MRETSELLPGTALDVGCGEGADAVWLARHAWRVTAVDISSVALERNTAAAKSLDSDMARRIDWRQIDITRLHPPVAAYDLVSAQFLHFPRAVREPLFAGLAAAVAPGGTLLIVGHHPTDLQTTMRRPSSAESLYSASDVAESLDLDLFEIVANEARSRTAVDPDGRTVTIRDAVLRARRHNNR